MINHETSSDLSREINRKKSLLRYYQGRSDHHSMITGVVLSSDIEALMKRKDVIKEAERLERLKVRYPQIVKLL